jgi:hypothetical protein
VGRSAADRAELMGGVDSTVAAPIGGGAATTVAVRSRFRKGWDVAAPIGYVLAAVVLTAQLWSDRDRTTYAGNDLVLFEWMLARAARVVGHGEHPLYAVELNAPYGINLMANTSVLGLGLPLAPVTLLFGSRTALLVAIVLCLAATATAWYLLLSRCLVRSRSAAALGGLCCGFAPGMVSQATAHLHMIAQFLVPALLWLVFRPPRTESAAGRAPERSTRIWRDGVLLGLLVTYQVFLGEEVLFLLALSCGVVVVGYALTAPGVARRAAPALCGRLGVGALVASALLAYPLWFQFFGPGHYRGLPFNPEAYGLDLASFGAAARQSLVGDERAAARLAPNLTEENSFLGLPLIGLCLVIVVWQWRRPLVRVLAGTGVLFAALSLGERIRVDGVETPLVGPYRLVAELPLLDLVVPARFALICVPVVAILLAISLDALRDDQPEAPRGRAGPPVRLLWTGAVAAVLVPLAPVPLETRPAWPVPEFIAAGHWRAYVPEGRTLVPVPPTLGSEATAGMLWSARTGLAFTAPGGYFIGPTGPDDPQARWGSPLRPTAVLLDRVAATGEVPEITEEQRRQAVEDLRHWRAAIVVQGGLRHGWPVKETLDRLLGGSREIAGAWVWDVRPLVG